MHFDRFDICEAYYVFANETTVPYTQQRILAQLQRVKFKPRPSLKGPSCLEENAYAIYRELWGAH